MPESLTIEPVRRRVRALFADHIIADTDDALAVREGEVAPVYYFPVDDVEMGYLGRTDHTTSHPSQGQATYFSIKMHSQIAENAVWVYEDPEPSAASLRGRLAFDASQIEVYEIDDADIERGVGHDAAIHPQ
jgi:uncharacterized protein (DUF427 family)